MHSQSQISDLFHALNAVRNSAINDMVAEGMDEVDAAIRYDLSEAPIGTNEEMLKAIGIDPAVAPLVDIIEGLSKWNIYLDETNHLNDEELRNYLVNTVLKDQIRIIPPNPDMIEWVNLGSVPGTPDSADRDAYLPRPAVDPRPSTVVHLN